MSEILVEIDAAVAGIIVVVFVSVMGIVLTRSFNQYTKDETYHRHEIDKRISEANKDGD